MPKQKLFLKDNKKKSKQPQAPATADEYLAAGVDFEEAGEKWRGGDAAKSTRFFLRAIDCYNEALKKFPSSFDLAYNRARVQYELTQHPKLLAQLPGDLLDLLQTALESSRYALALKQDNADVLFNTAQILTSLVEASTESRSNSTPDTLPLLEEALELFQRCLALQEYQYTESQTQDGTMSDDPSMETSDLPDSEEGGVSLTSDEEPPQDDRWATIVEPVTNNTLVDTVLAQLETLTLLCNLIPSSSDPTPLTFITEYSSNLLNTKLPSYLADTGREAEAHLIIANFQAAHADLSYRLQKLDFESYTTALTNAFSPLDLTNHPEALVNQAEALLSFNSTVRTHPPPSPDPLPSRWSALTTALSRLATAAKLPAASHLSKIHLLRGDLELHRYQLGCCHPPFPTAAANGPVLLKNAEKFYRGAAALASDGKERVEASVKEELVRAFRGEGARIGELAGESEARSVLEEALEEGLIAAEQLQGLGIS